MTSTDRNEPLVVWMDGQCPLCRQSQRWAEARDRHGRLRFRDFRGAPDDELPLPREEMDKALRVRVPDGRLLGGFAGWRALMAALPRWRWLAVATGIPPLRWLGPPVYRFISHHRHHLPVPMPDEPPDQPGEPPRHSSTGTGSPS